MTICDLCLKEGKINDAPETCIECSADMCPQHGEGEFCAHCLREEAHLQNASNWELATASV